MTCMYDHHMHLPWPACPFLMMSLSLLCMFFCVGLVFNDLNLFFFDAKWLVLVCWILTSCCNCCKYSDRTSVSQKACGEALNRKKRKRKDYSPDSNREAVCDPSPENWDDLEASEISPHCLINQAYAAAVRTLMQGNLAALNTVGASATYRRWNKTAGQSLHMAKSKGEDAGSIINFGCGDITLLELFLHSRRQREQLQARFH